MTLLGEELPGLDWAGFPARGSKYTGSGLRVLTGAHAASGMSAASLMTLKRSRRGCGDSAAGGMAMGVSMAAGCCMFFSHLEQRFGAAHP